MTMMFVFLMISLMSIFSNALFYTISLLMVSIVLLVWMVSSNCMSVLMLLLVTIVYIGAMMILIGYICAVCPNFTLIPNYEYSILMFLSFVLGFIICFSFYTSNESVKSSTLLDYFFSNWGFYSFIMIALMLFFILLMVTSQYNSPQGPLRSL